MNVIWTLKVSNPAANETTRHTISKNPIYIGRSLGMDLRLDDSKVSGRHFCLTFEDSRIFVEDLDSTNGVFIYKKGTWKRINNKVRARPPILVNAGKVINIIVKAHLEGEDSGLDLSRFDGLDANSSFVESIDEVETFEAILVVDLCRSSEIAWEDDKMAFHMKKKLKEVCEWSFGQFESRFTKSTGDGFLVTFEKPSAALFAAKQILADLQQRNERTSNPPIHVRFAIHVGKTYTIDDESNDIHGNDVNIAFRIEGVTPDLFDNEETQLPETNRIVCSEEFRAAVSEEESVLSNFNFEKIGPATLKGIKEAKDLYLVVI